MAPENAMLLKIFIKEKSNLYPHQLFLHLFK